MKIKHEIPIQMLDVFVTYYCYGDMDTLTNREIRLAKDLHNDLVLQFGLGHWTFSGETDEFAQCEITNEWGRCETGTYTVMGA